VVVLGTGKTPPDFVKAAGNTFKLRKGKLFLPFAVKIPENVPPSLGNSKLRIIYALDW